MPKTRKNYRKSKTQKRKSRTNRRKQRGGDLFNIKNPAQLHQDKLKKQHIGRVQRDDEKWNNASALNDY